MSVMIESIGSRSKRWMQIKREEFMLVEEAARGSKNVPSCLQRQPSRLLHAISSLSSSSVSRKESSESNSKSGEHEKRRDMVGNAECKPTSVGPVSVQEDGDGATKVSLSSGSGNEDSSKGSSQGYHDYNAKPLPDPKLVDGDASNRSIDESPEDSGNSKGQNIADSSSDDAISNCADEPDLKRRKVDFSVASSVKTLTSDESGHSTPCTSLPTAKIAKSGGIPHNILPVLKKLQKIGSTANGPARLEMTPPVPVTFAGIGKRSTARVSSYGTASKADKSTSSSTSVGNSANGGPAMISADAETSSNSSSCNMPQIKAHYYINEDDMIIMDEVLMCPFIFRSQDAVLCGALSECTSPGMLRAHFSKRNKLLSLEMVYDSMGVMQQLERANGNEGTPQIIPGNLEMALSPTTSEARVITLAKAPFLIVNVNEVWTKTTGYTQSEVEGRPYLALLDGEHTVPAASERRGKPRYNLDDVAKGKSACMTNIHYDKYGNDYIEFVCSYRLIK
jgi:hypothetical protein